MELTSEEDVKDLVASRFWRSRTKKKKALLWGATFVLVICVLFFVAYITDRSAEYENMNGDIVKVQNWDVELNGYEMTRTDNAEIGWLLGSLICLVIAGITAGIVLIRDSRTLNKEKKAALKEWYLAQKSE